ncbi:MAG: 4-hydroxy-tetrahydrodipicolinate synthase [Deltaproteobacteria bacterium RBG_16_48_10]|nr:MAG: 4-hydroxy-tetrahydrodipicolinate synthase [Deltaproteobacteria bacterium RBG_16_48_10]
MVRIRQKSERRKRMISGKDIKGIIAAIVTPFSENEEVDYSGLRVITEYLLDGGVDGIMTSGGTGEFPHLTREEKKLVVKTIVEVCKGKVPIIAGTAACSTRECLSLMEDAKESGADAAIMVPPYYFVLNEEAIFNHFKILSQANILPLVIYNNPLYTGNPMSPALIVKLLEMKNIIGLKQSCVDMGQLVEIIRMSKGGSSICTGVDSQFYPALTIGAVGVYSTAGGIFPNQMKQVHNLFLQGRLAQAKDLHIKLQIVNRFLEYDPGYVSPAKEALNMIGLPAGVVRRPMPNLTPGQKEDLRLALRAIGLNAK